MVQNVNSKSDFVFMFVESFFFLWDFWDLLCFYEIYVVKMDKSFNRGNRMYLKFLEVKKINQNKKQSRF